MVGRVLFSPRFPLWRAFLGQAVTNPHGSTHSGHCVHSAMRELQCWIQQAMCRGAQTWRPSAGVSWTWPSCPWPASCSAAVLQLSERQARYGLCLKPGMCDGQGRLDVEAQCRGFLDLAKLAMACLLSCIFTEPAVASLFGAPRL